MLYGTLFSLLHFLAGRVIAVFLTIEPLEQCFLFPFALFQQKYWNIITPLLPASLKASDEFEVFIFLSSLVGNSFFCGFGVVALTLWFRRRAARKAPQQEAA